MLSFDEKFQELWVQIPKIATFRDYCRMANTIYDARTNREITKQDETTLYKALDIFKEARNVEDIFKEARNVEDDW